MTEENSNLQLVTTEKPPSGFDIDHSIFSFKFCLESLFSTVNKASLFFHSQVNIPDWFRHYKNTQSHFDSDYNEETFKSSFRSCYLNNKKVFENLDEKHFNYPLLTGPKNEGESVGSSDCDVIMTEGNDEEGGEEILHLSTLYQEIEKKYYRIASKPHKEGGKKVVKFHPIQFLFYLTFCMYNSLQDEDGGDELWDHLISLSQELDSIFDHHGPSSEGPGALVESVSSNPNLQGFMKMASSLGLDLSGSSEAMGSIGKIISKVTSSPSMRTGPEEFNVNDICNSVSEAFANPEIQSEFQNLFTNGKKIFDTNTQIVNNPAFQNNIKNIAGTFMNAKKK